MYVTNKTTTTAAQKEREKTPLRGKTSISLEIDLLFGPETIENHARNPNFTDVAQSTHTNCIVCVHHSVNKWYFHSVYVPFQSTKQYFTGKLVSNTNNSIHTFCSHSHISWSEKFFPIFDMHDEKKNRIWCYVIGLKTWIFVFSFSLALSSIFTTQRRNVRE